MQKENILILWSGGIDSTAYLKWYLENTTHNIVAHHVFYSLTNNQQRQQKEREAIAKLLPKLQEIRKFTYVESVLAYDTNSVLLDVDILTTFSIPIAVKYQCAKMVIGFVSDIRHEQIVYVAKHITHLNKIAECLYEVSGKINGWKVIPQLHLPEFYGTKQKYIDTLDDLLLDTWWCRGVPDEKGRIILGDKPCGKCMTCKHVERSLDVIMKN